MNENKKHLDATDNRIIEMMKADGRRTLDSMAQDLGLSITSVQKRLQSLINNRVISIYATLRIDMDESPVVAVTAMNVDYGHIRLLVDDFSDKAAFGTLARTLGRYDLISTSMFKSLKDLSTHVEQVLPSSQGIKSSETFVCLTIFKGNYGRVNPYLISTDDRDLIALLMKDGRQSNKLIAEKLGISASSVGRRITQLTNSGTIRFTTTRFPEHRHFFAAFITAEKGNLQTNAQALAKQPEVLFLATITGRYDIFATFDFENEDQFIEFLEEKLAKMAGIKDVEALFLMKSLWLYDAIFDKYWVAAHPARKTAAAHGKQKSAPDK